MYGTISYAALCYAGTIYAVSYRIVQYRTGTTSIVLVSMLLILALSVICTVLELTVGIELLYCSVYFLLVQYCWLLVVGKRQVAQVQN
jgi:ABC-type Na+ efflux pump permease subunit